MCNLTHPLPLWVLSLSQGENVNGERYHPLYPPETGGEESLSKEALNVIPYPQKGALPCATLGLERTRRGEAVDISKSNIRNVIKSTGNL
jgi:hypothetical protein